MHGLWYFFLERRAFTVLTMVSLTLLGVYALVKMPKEANPEVTIPSAIVSVALPGATASDVERLIVDKLEPTVRNVSGVDTVTSNARESFATITVEFNQGVDLDAAVQDVRNAVDREKGELPSDATDPVVVKIDTSDQPILVVAISSELPPETLTTLGEDLEDQLSAIDGVSKVQVSGVRDREVSIIVRKEALQEYDISLQQIMGALRSANASAPAGVLTIDGVHYPVQFKGDITRIEDIRDLPLRTPSGEIKLSDIATIVDGFEKTSSLSHLSVGGSDVTYALTLSVYKSKGGSILNVSQDVEDKLDSLKDTTLKGSEAVVTYDAAEEVRTNIEDLTEAGRDTIILVMLVLFVSIGLLEAFVSALSIPLSFVIAFILMWLTGNTVNFLSLFSLIIAIGILVDSGIVVVEAIHTNREKGMEKMQAAREAIRQYAWPLIAGTMTTVAVFFPLFFLSGIIGEYMQSIPFTVIVVLLASIVVALGFVPILALWLLRHEESRFAAARERLWESIATRYSALLSRLFASRSAQRYFLGGLALSFIFAISLPVSGMLKVSMFPPSDMDFFYIEVELPQASTLQETERVTRLVEDVISRNAYVESYTAEIGATSAFVSWDGATSNSKFANLTVNLVDDRGSEHSSLSIAADMRKQFAELETNAKISVIENAGGPPSGAPIVVKVWSDDSVKLGEATDAIERIIESAEGTRDASSSLKNDGTQLAIAIDRDRVNEYGLSTSDIAAALQASIAGAKATTVRFDGKDVDVRVMLDLNERFVNPEDTTKADVEALSRIPVSTSRGVVPLGSFVTITAERSSTEIRHEDGERLGTVSAYLNEGANAVEVTNSIRSKIAEASLPDGVRVTYGGDDEDIAKTFTEMILALVAGIVLMFAILVLEFNAFRTSGRLLLAVPLSLTGVLIGLWISRQPLSITAMLGIIALGGVLINHGILLLDVLNNLRKSDAAISPEALVLGAARTRIRPILLTTVTTMIGMIPLMFISAMWAPLAYTIAFGLLYGTLLTLVLIPLLSYRYETKRAKRESERMVEVSLHA